MNQRMFAILKSLVAVTLALYAGDVHAVNNSYQEDFTTLTYCDTLNTTACWDTTLGELRLHPFELRVLGEVELPGPVYDVAVDGDLAVVATPFHYCSFWCVDVSDPSNPTTFSCASTSDFRVVALAGNTAYAAGPYGGGEGWLQCFDVSDPGNIQQLGSCNPSDEIVDMYVDGDLLFTASGAALEVIDVSDPSLPHRIGVCLLGYYLTGVVVDGDTAYLVDYNGQLHTVDVSDPTNPVSLGQTYLYHAPEGLAVAGNTAYSVGSGTLNSIDVSDPANPAILGECYLADIESHDVVVAGDVAYVTSSYYSETHRLELVDISNPSSPTWIGDCTDAVGVGNLAVDGGLAYVAGGSASNTLQVVDVGDVGALSLKGSCAWHSAEDVAVAGNVAYVTTDEPSLIAIDITDTSAPERIGHHLLGDDPGRGLAVAGDVAYVTCKGDGLKFFDVADPSNPTLFCELTLVGNTDFVDVELAGNYAYVIDMVEDLLIIDITERSSPGLVGHVGVPGPSTGVALAGDVAYVANLHDGSQSTLRSIDISDPTNPILLGTLYTGSNSSADIAVAGDFVYLAEGHSGIRVIDVSDPANPTLITTCCEDDGARELAVAGNVLCVVNMSAGFLVVDITDPADPEVLKEGIFSCYSDGMAVAGEHIFIANDVYGLYVTELYQRDWNTADSQGASEVINTLQDPIVRARLTSQQQTGVLWRFHTNGADWEDSIVPGGPWHKLPWVTSTLQWQSRHVLQGPGINPTATSLSINWLYEFPNIQAISDVPGDQGRQVRVTWLRSGHDFLDAETPVTEYGIYRRIEERGAAPTPESGAVRARDQRWPPGTWDYVTTVPARGEDEYAVVVPTLADSTVTDGLQWSTFFVSALTSTPGIYYDSYPDSGYSVDNLAPSVPENFRFADENLLAWDEAVEEDFDYFSVYGSEVGYLDSSAELIGHTTETEMPIQDHAHAYYHLTATDFSGNEGQAATLADEVSAVPGSGDASPEGYAFWVAGPNPLAGSTRLCFELPRAAGLHLEIMDVRGRCVRVLNNGVLPGGRHTLRWDGRSDQGHAVASGTYFARLRAGTFRRECRLLVLR